MTHTVGSENTTLYRVPVLGGPPQKLKEDLASAVTFSPDGARYAFIRESASESKLVVVDRGSGREQALVSRKLPEVLDYPAWSPDGRTIACTTFDSSTAGPRGSDARIIDIRVADRRERLLSRQTWAFIRQLAWFGDGSGLAMSARDRDSDRFHVWYVSYPGGAGRKITDGLNSETGASVSADSRQIVTIEESKYSGLWRMRARPPQDPVPLVSGSGGYPGAQWMPDGRILFGLDLNGRAGLWTVNTDGTHQKQLAMPGNIFDASISEDGRVLACTSDRDGSTAIWTMDLDGQHPVMVAKADGDTAPQLSPDGKWVAFTALGTGRWHSLWRVGARGGTVAHINGNLWRSPAISHDGKWIAGFYGDRNLSTGREPGSIAVISSDGGEPTKLFPMAASVSLPAGIRWSRDGRELNYVDQRKDGANVWSQPLKGGAPRQVTEFQGDSIFSFDWCPDGTNLVVSRGVQARNVVLIRDAQRK